MMSHQTIRFGKRLWAKMRNDDVIFLASGISFNVLACLLPMMLLWIYVLGLWFPAEETLHFVERVLATAFPDQPYTLAIREGVASILRDLAAHRKSFGLLSLTILTVTSASLFSSMRSALHRVFLMKADHHFLLTYLLDMGMVFALTMLIIGTTSLVWVIRFLRKMSRLLAAVGQWDVPGLWGVMPNVVAVPIIFVLCYLLYRYVPIRVIPRRTAALAAGITTAIWEISGFIFALYLNHATTFGKIYGAYAFLLVLMLWVFYSCAIFILGAEMGCLLQNRAIDEE